MKPITIGPGVTCDLGVLLNTRLLIQANSGAGKSWALRRLLEQTHGQVQQLIIDPEGEFVTLRERFDVVVAAKSGGDTLAEPRTATLLAERLLELGVSAVLDIYELKAHERVAFVKKFLEALVDAPKKLWHPALVVLDEAHVYAPEKGSAESLQAVIDLATRGRKRGYCLVQATQRLSKLHKDAAAEMNNKLIGRSALDVDMDRAGDELGLSKADRRQLRDLDAGEFYAFGPALTRTVTRVKVAGVETRHPKAGSKLSSVVPPPTDKVRAVLSKLADLPAEAEQRQQTEAQLRARVAELERELKTRIRGVVLTAAEPAKTVEVLADADRALLKSLADVGDAIRRQWGNSSSMLVTLLHPVLNDFIARLDDTAFKAAERDATRLAKALDGAGLARIVEKLGRLPAPPVPAQVGALMGQATGGAALAKGLGMPAPHRPAPRMLGSDAKTGSGTLSGPEQKIINAVAELRVLGLHPADKLQVGLLAGYTNVRSGGFSEPLGRLVAAGLVASPAPGQLALTDSGAAQAEVAAAPTTPDEMQARVLAKLTGPEQKLLRELLRHYPAAITKEALGTACGYTNIRSGGFSEPLGRLNTLGIVRTPARGSVVAAPFLFLEGGR